MVISSLKLKCRERVSWLLKIARSKILPRATRANLLTTSPPGPWPSADCFWRPWAVKHFNAVYYKLHISLNPRTPHTCPENKHTSLVTVWWVGLQLQWSLSPSISSWLDIHWNVSDSPQSRRCLSSLKSMFIFSLRFLGLVLIYLVVGSAYQYFGKQERGIRILPNYDFWMAFAGYVWVSTSSL